MEKRYGKVDDACERYSIGRNNMYRLGKETKASLKYGGILIFDFEILDAYFENLRKEQNGLL